MKQKKNGLTEWTKVKGQTGVKVIGSAKRFSISIEVDDDFLIGINACRIAEGKSGKFISYPAWKDADGEYHDYCFLKLPEEAKAAIIETLED